ncbi:MAG: L-aspartate oxidase [Absicoccus sp.]|uniref:L-aspartate oxidase n=1 Tax=Absicoccus intestinalis TaxID=2926319 RepID=A0ABU4WPF6_9FIRM|nr:MULTISPECIES: L-aspartate oxidase [unclassified Absicoccus]MDX8417643.1 L-aspartate oxidase [Absicoccus sp. CLA-KB-P134]MDY3036255.1 L-aspartate oxidase [Absicoccus sp.]
MKTDICIVGCGCSGLYAALQLPKNKKILMITKSDAESSDSFLAQGGICILKNEADYQSYFKDTMKAGHYENDPESVEIMIRSSQDVIHDLIKYGTDFHKDKDGKLDYTREGAHSHARILFHEDETGKEITKHLLEKVRALPNVTLLEYTTMLDIVEANNTCYGIIMRKADGTIETVSCDYVLLATGGVGGVYRHSTNFRHLTGDGIAVAIRHHITLKNINYVQIHPTTFYSPNEKDRSFLISESVRGEGALLYDKNMQRFTNELLPRDLLTEKIREQMKKDGTNHVWEDLRPIGHEQLMSHFPHIVQHCLEMGYDPEKEPIPVVPAQHYFMGGIKVNKQSKTSMDHLYAIGETACNGVHGKNRLASNSLLESLVFAKRAAKEIASAYEMLHNPMVFAHIQEADYTNMASLKQTYRHMVQAEVMV